MKKRFKYTIAAIFATISAIFAVPNGAFYFEQDHASFRGSEDLARLELYLVMGRDHGSWEQVEGGYSAELNIMTQIIYEGENIFTDYDAFTDRCEDPGGLDPLSALPRQMNFSMQEGKYTIRQSVFNSENKVLAQGEFEVEVPDFSSGGAMLSEIELVSAVVEQKERTLFSKYGVYDIIPKGSAVYDPGKQDIQLLLEMYGLGSKGTDYRVTASVLDLNGRLVHGFETEQFSVSQDMEVYINRFDIGVLKNGIYDFAIAVEPVGGSEMKRVKRIYIRNAVQDIDASAGGIYSDLDSVQLDSVLANLISLIDKDELDLFRRSSEKGKREFLTNFWSDRVLRRGEGFRREIEQRISYANRQFSSLFQRGAITDRGQILIKYGYPDDVQVYSSISEGKPHDIWFYNKLEGGVEFIFVDLDNSGHYELVHSTMRGEKQNSNWENLIRR